VSSDAVAMLFREGMQNTLVAGAPLMIALLVVGLLVGIMQSATQIQEPAVGAVPRLTTVILVAVFLGPWMVERLARFLHMAIERLGDRSF
jgi:flagellar biosynthesis protein FliQ